VPTRACGRRCATGRVAPAAERAVPGDHSAPVRSSNAVAVSATSATKSNSPLPEHHNSVYVVRSLDDGRTWEEPRLVQDGYCGALRNMIQLRSGRIILGCQLAVSDPGRHVTFILASDDDDSLTRTFMSVGPPCSQRSASGILLSRTASAANRDCRQSRSGNSSRVRRSLIVRAFP
jgi:hypothetical protein